MMTSGFLILLTFLCIATLTVKREHMVVPLIIAMCYLPADIPLKVGVYHIYALRAVALMGLLRVMVAGDLSRIESNKIDKLFFSYNIIGSIIYILASFNTVQAIIFKCGVFVDSIVLYLVLRTSIESKSTINLIVKTFAGCVLMMLPFVVFEYFTSNNLFSIFGRSGLSVRDGEIRAAATFSHPILFGSFAAVIAPLLWAKYRIGKEKRYLAAFFCCMFFIYASSSSGPIVVFAGVIFLLSFFVWRNHSKILARCILAVVIFIHFARESPFWHFFYARVSIKGSSTGWHRYLLAEAAVEEFPNWWLLGYGDIGPQWHDKYWPYTHATFTDVTNHYLLEGVRGGFITMCLFIVLCYTVIRTLGTAAVIETDLESQWLLWGFTVMMIAHCITFLSVSYFGQITMLLYLTIAVGSFVLSEANKKKTS
jgi:hypothetical protein